MKKYIVPMALVVLTILSIVIVLAGNKQKIKKAATPVDRASIAVAVNVATAVPGEVKTYMVYPAITQPYEKAMLYAQTSGMISSLNVKPGQFVRKGEVLGRLDTRLLSNNLNAATISKHAAEINKEKLWDDYIRAKDLFENKAGLEINMITAKNNYDNAVNSFDNSIVQIQQVKQQIANADIVSLLNGTISAHNIKQGEFVNPGSAIAAIIDISSVKATVYVDQELAYVIRTGQSANITAPVFPSDTLEGKIIFISPVADQNHNYQVDLLISNKDQRLLLGGTDVQVSFRRSQTKAAMFVPKQSVLNDAAEPYVYVVGRDTVAVRNIKTGKQQDNMLQVLSGLEAGETVVTNGQINLKTGSKITINK